MSLIKYSILFFVLFSYSLYSNTVDSLETTLGKLKGKDRIEPLLTLAGQLWNVQPDKALNYAEEALMQSTKINDPVKIASSHAYSGMSHEYKGEYDSSLYHYNISMQKYREANDTTGIIRQYINIGLTYYAQGFYDKTIESYNKGLDLAVKFGAKPAEGSLLNNIAMVYQSLKEHDKALEYYQKTYDIRVQTNDPFMIARALSNIGSVYSEIDEVEKALSYNQNALKYFEEVGFERGISKSLNNIGINYVNMGKYNEAIDAFNRSLKIKEKNNDLKGFIKTYQNFAVLYSKLGKAEQAFEYLEKANKIIKENNFTDFASEIPYHFYEVHKNLGNHKEALEYYMESERILDSIRSNESKQKLSELNIKYESLAKEKENEILKQDNKIKHLELQKEVSTNHMLITFLVLIIIAIIVVIYLYLQKRKNANLLELRNKELADINDKLKESEEQLKTISNTKDKLYSVIAHDLMNPITVFISLSDYLISYSKDLSKEDFEESLVDINSSAKGLMHLLKNMLQWAKQQSGMMQPKFVKYDINDLIKDNIQLFSSDLNFKKLIIEHNLKNSMPAVFDVNMINTVIRNLISNAIKFSEEGGRILIETTSENGYVNVCVKDNGVGIEDEYLQKLFNIEDAHSTPGTNLEIGTGLGLLICKEFIDLCNGKIWVDSKPNEGAAFNFSVPEK